MMVEIVLLALAATSQADALFTNTMPPPGVPTFEITISGEEPFFAAIQINGEWVAEHNPEIRDSQNIDIFVDNPFYSATPFSVPKRRTALKYEPSAMRRARLEELWTSNGYSFLETASGWRAIHERDIVLAERAREMALAAARKPAAQFQPTADQEGREQPGRLSNRALLGLRALIVLAGVLAMAIALKYIFHKEAAWKPLS